jgi:hypothetical protein
MAYYAKLENAEAIEQEAISSKGQSINKIVRLKCQFINPRFS